MGPAYYVIAILGCGDGAAQCTPVATVPTRYESQAACASGTADALVANSDLDFPTLLAECHLSHSKAAAEQPDRLPASAARS